MPHVTVPKYPFAPCKLLPCSILEAFLRRYSYNKQTVGKACRLDVTDCRNFCSKIYRRNRSCSNASCNVEIRQSAESHQGTLEMVGKSASTLAIPERQQAIQYSWQISKYIFHSKSDNKPLTGSAFRHTCAHIHHVTPRRPCSGGTWRSGVYCR